MGRRRKFRLADIVWDGGRLSVVVDYRVRGSVSEYRVVPISGKRRRYGRASWRRAMDLHASGERSNTASLLTYRANQHLDDALDDRGCDCECCIHTAQPRSDFSHITGIMKGADDDR